MHLECFAHWIFICDMYPACCGYSNGLKVQSRNILQELRSCVKEEVDDLGFPSLIVRSLCRHKPTLKKILQENVLVIFFFFLFFSINFILRIVCELPINAAVSCL